jgi:DNA polymerase III epsilon subunit-like protein
MKFNKDILIIDFEGRKEPTQIGAVLLDKATLEEKDSFLSYIYSDLNGHISPVSGITQEMLNGAPTQAKVGQMLFEKFGVDVLISSWVADLDITNFKKIITAAGKSFSDYDYHIFDIWPPAYVYALKHGYTGSIRSEEMFRYFGAKPRALHNALEDCRIAADILRKIVL